MIRVNIKRDQKGSIVAFEVSGHAGYEEHGRDIICAAASALSYAAIGYFEERYNPRNCPEQSCYEERDGYLHWVRPALSGDEAIVAADAVLEAMRIGFLQIQESYGKKYVTVYE